MKKRILITALSLLLIAALACGCTQQAAPDEDAQLEGSQTEEPTEPAETQEPASAPDDSPAPSDEPETTVPVDGSGNEPAGQEFPVVLECGQSYSVDLDGDGSQETIVYTPGTDGEQMPMEFESLTINGQEYRDSVYNDEFFTDWLVTDYWAVTDLDTSDGLLEIAIMDYGPSDDNVTYFFRYDGGELSYIGYIPGFVYDGDSGKSDTTFKGDGTVESYLRLSVLQTWWAPAAWTPGNGYRFDLVGQELYYPFPDRQGSSVTVITPVAGYAERSTDSERSLIPAGTGLTLTATDNVQWVLAQTADGGQFWLHLNNQDGYAFELEVESGYEIGSLVLDGLLMVD